ncbi:mitochondrial protein cyt-4 [Hypoxylon rubiginosum]|uniref:Mitochondrial protein cyt-4 n=1 Tax=Hypoxylon rubiginosum TaxID=110542 RepID=A0ACC0DM43_9PEZI|nr:mitochondrial protein cyt-4 [Hypoxylon rubiginosum]
MFKVSSKSYVCWRCASRRSTLNGATSRLDVRLLSRTHHSQWRRTLATVHHPASNRSAKADANEELRAKEEQRRKRLPIRERLRIWDEEHHDEVKTMLSDFADSGELSNSYTRPQNVSMANPEIASPLFDGDELGDLRSEDSNLNPGDMVELSSEGSRRPLLAICLGRLNGFDNFYTSSGKWFTGLGVKTLFVVHNFVEPAELKPIINELPSSETPLDALNALQDLGHNPSRSSGAPLLRRMLNFSHEAEAVYQANAGTLDASSAFIGDPVKHRYLTLHEIAELLLPQSYHNDGKFDPHALYAVHRALMQDEVFFRPLRHTGHRRSYLFEISPLSEVRIIQRAETLVREHLERNTRQQNGHKGNPSPMQVFITNAQRLIDESRKTREWTGTGIIGPSKSEAKQVTHDWSPTELEILQFIELWASYQKFPKHSRLQCFGSAILRALDRYKDAETLSASTGWSFLQEVGWIPSWEIPARYTIRFPGVEIKPGGGYVRPYFGNLERHLKRDTLAPFRKVWKNTTAYCIDSESTMDIDDAVSLERTADPDKYWIHVHVADPSASIQAESPVAKYAELVPETIYLPGHFERMLPGSISQDRFSLAPDRSCLTFSALVDKNGTILEHKITPGILKNVVYMTSEDAALAIEDRREDPIVGEGEVKLGPLPKAKPANRSMTRPGDLNNKQKNELELLSQLGRAIQAHRLNKGATPFFQPRAEAQAYFDHLPQEGTSNTRFVTGDPSIRIAYSQRSGTDLVENAMRLAGEIAARWCHDRGIPIPFHSQPHAVKNAALIQQYTRDVFYPLLKAGIRPHDNQWRHLRSLIGSDEITTTAGPHFTLGVDMYTKATSPLRRFSDLIVHWQIQAALVEENRRRARLVGNTDDSFLPFSRERLDRMLPMIRVREKQARALASGDGGDQWILQALVRAWRFGEAALPDTFRFSVLHTHGRRSVLGRLDWFERAALLRPDALNGVLKMADVRVGDVYEVKLKNVNVHANQVFVEAVGVLEKKADEIPVAPAKGVGEDGIAADLT